MATPINSTKAAALIEAHTSRPCTRQNLEKLCDKGALQGSVCIVQRGPWRFDADLVVSEYLARVALYQSEAKQPHAKREQPALRRQACPAPPFRPADDSEVPDFNEERARHEREKRMLAELARQEKERELLRRDDVMQAWQAAVNMTRTKLLGVPSVVKARIPHLEADEVEVITMLIREALDELAAGEVKA